MTVTSFEYQLQSAEATWTYARWEQLPDDGNRYEVIDGVLYMSTAPGNRHQYIVSCLVEQVGMPMKHDGVALYTFAPIGLLMPGCEPVQPDFLLLRAERAALFFEDDRIRGVPDLIAEILSPGNPEHDLVTKRAAYARAGVPEYWIVRPETQDVIVLTSPAPGRSDFSDERVFTTADDLVSPTLPVRVPVAALFELPPGPA
jgi:Uma2 family endonuclease